MKKLLTILLILYGFIAIAQPTPLQPTPLQPTGYTWIASKYDWWGGKFRYLHVPAGPTPVLHTYSGSGAVFVDSVNHRFYFYSGGVWRYGGEVTQSALDDTAAAIRGDFPTGSAANANVGAFYRWLNPATQEMKTFAPGYGFLLDSTTNTNALTGSLDMPTIADSVATLIPNNLLIYPWGTSGYPILRPVNDTLYHWKIEPGANITIDTSSGSWVISAASSSLTLAAFGTSPNSSGASYSAGTLTLQPASATQPGGLSNTTQSWAGDKTNTGTLTVSGNFTASSLATLGASVIGNVAANAATGAQYQIEDFGTGGMGYRAAIYGSTAYSIPTSGYGFASLMVGHNVITERSAGSHPVITNAAALSPVINNGGATTDVGAAFFVQGEPTGTATLTRSRSMFVAKGRSQFGGPVLLDTSTTAAATAPLYFPSGTNMTTPENGAMEFDGTHLYFSIGSTRYQIDQQPRPTLTKNAVVENPTSAENIFIFRTPVAITVTDVTAVLVGSSTPSVTYNIAFGTDRTSLTNVYTAGQTVTSTTTGTAASGVNDNTIPANSWVVLTTSAQSGTVGQLNIGLTYTQD